MNDTTPLMEAIAAAVLDNLTLSFSPVDPDGSGLPTGMVVGLRHNAHGRVYDTARAVGFDELVLSGAADKVLSETIADAVDSIVDVSLGDVAPHAV